MNRFYTLSTALRQIFNKPVQKIPLDSGATCPNRDSTLSTKGCIFCNDSGTSAGLFDKGTSFEKQWLHWKNELKNNKSKHFIAYLQSYSNTYMPFEKLQATCQQLIKLNDAVGVSIATRPDCLDLEKIELIDNLPFDFIQLDLGLQSSFDKTLNFINRGHSVKDFEKILLLTKNTRIFVCVHFMLGLPYEYGKRESSKEFLEHMTYVNALPIQSVKLHNCLVLKNTPLAKLYADKQYVPLEEAEYIETIGEALQILDPRMVVKRINTDTSNDDCIAPLWATNKAQLLRDIQHYLIDAKAWQGAKHPLGKNTLPAWFQHDSSQNFKDYI